MQSFATPFIIYEAFQLCLKALTQALISNLDFPPEIETVVRDLWLIFVTKQGIRTWAGIIYRRKIRKGLIWLNQIQLLGFIYLGCRILRLPFLVADVLRWAESGAIPFLNALDILPSEFLRTVSRKCLLYVLSAHRIPPAFKLIRVIEDVKVDLMSEGVSFPEINRPLILIRLIQTYRLPPEIYVCTEILFSVLRDDKIPYAENMEMRLISCLIIAIRISQSMSTLTVEGLEADFGDHRNDFLFYCQNYIFENDSSESSSFLFFSFNFQLNSPFFLFGLTQGEAPIQYLDVRVDEIFDRNTELGLPSLRRSPRFPQPVPHALESVAENASEIDFRTTPATDQTVRRPQFEIKSFTDLRDTSGAVDRQFADLMEFASHVLSQDSRVIARAVVKVEGVLHRKAELMDIQTL
ncbi:Pol I core factor CF [Entophlyctis luteolus]|nr:Pol I core factor CF [Entophlyctis luteolus]